MKSHGDKFKENDDATVASDGYKSVEVLAISNMDSEKEWIIDSGCLYHMTPNRTWFKDYSQEDSGMVLLGNNKPNKVVGIGLIRISMYDGMEKILQNVRYVL